MTQYKYFYTLPSETARVVYFTRQTYNSVMYLYTYEGLLIAISGMATIHKQKPNDDGCSSITYWLFSSFSLKASSVHISEHQYKIVI